jgi:Phosphoesterase family
MSILTGLPSIVHSQPKKSPVRPIENPKPVFSRLDFQVRHEFSNPLDEQEFLVKTINFIEKSKFWDSTAVIVTYDDSDGWYDHQVSPIVNSSTGVADFLNGTGVCGDQEKILPGIDSYNEHATARCGHGPRLPILVISPWAKTNFVDHTLTDQTSVIRFVEDNWLGGERIRRVEPNRSIGHRVPQRIAARAGVFRKQVHFAAMERHLFGRVVVVLIVCRGPFGPQAERVRRTAAILWI